MKINFVGDVGIFRVYEDLIIDPLHLVELPLADLNIANFEFIIPQKREAFFYDVQDHYSCSYSFLKRLHLDTFDGYGLANNHVLDYGHQGVKDVNRLMQSRGVQTFGFSTDEDFSIGTFIRERLRIGIIAFVKKGRWDKEKHGFGPDTYEHGKIITIIKELKPKYDHLIIYPHWGTELVEIPVSEDIQNARAYIDAGATAVIGHHPHICQGIEPYKNGVIAYSLGSFIYIPDEELGSSGKDRGREISICLQLDLTKDGMSGYRAFYYKLNSERMIPEKIDPESIRTYIEFLNSNIHNHSLYKKQVRSKLIKRELRSFWQRFRARPVRTCVNYVKYLNPSKLRTLID